MKFPKLATERILLLLIGLNALDAISTHAALKMGIAYELNPLMRWAYAQGADYFWAMKMGLLGLALTLLGWFASEAALRKVVLGACFTYLLVLLIHAHGWLSYFLS